MERDECQPQRVCVLTTGCGFGNEQKKAAALYTQAGDYQKTARFYYKKAEDTYYQVRAQSGQRGGKEQPGLTACGEFWHAVTLPDSMQQLAGFAV